MNMNLEPMVAGIFGVWEIILLFAVVLLVLALISLGIGLIIYFNWRNQPANASPPPATAPPAPPAYPKTQVIPRQCPQCGASLPPDAPEGLCPACLLKRGFATETAAAPQPAFEPPPIAELAKLFPQLEIIECLGRGGMGAVYKARQPHLERLVALKILAPEKKADPQFAERFAREARALARLNHPNIVTVYDSGEAQGHFYLIMEYVDGLTLRQVLRHGKLSPAEALNLVPKICEALQYAHDQGIVHRDIKPENILLDHQGRVKIADFGIAKIAGQEPCDLSLTGSHDVMGTPHYMAPEQVETPQQVDHRADIYSLGVVFYEMLTGELPLGKFAAPSKKVQVDVRLDEVVLHALEKEPARRYQQASQVKTAVQSIASSPPPVAAPPAAVSPARPQGLITAPAVALMVVAVGKFLSSVIAIFFLTGLAGWLGSLPDVGEAFGGINFFGVWRSVAVISIIFFKIIPAGCIFYGAYHMLQRRSYAWAMAAAIVSIISCSFIGFPVGVWALIILTRAEVRAAFGLNHVAAAPAMASAGRAGKQFAVLLLSLLALPLGLVAVILLGCFAFTSFGGSSARAGDLSPAELQQAGIRPDGGGFRKDSTQTFPLDQGGKLSLDNVNGRIEIHGWSSNLVVLNAAIHGHTAQNVQAIKINVSSDPRQITIHTGREADQPADHGFWSWFKLKGKNDANVDYVLQVPSATRLNSVTSVNGDIVIDAVTDDIAASTVNGSLHVQNAANSLKLSTVNGSVNAAMDALDHQQSVALDSVNGEITLAVPETAAASFTANTVNGDISSDFPELVVKKEFPVCRSLAGKLGQSQASVKASTVNGSIKVIKRPAANPRPVPTPAPLAAAVTTQ